MSAAYSSLSTHRSALPKGMKRLIGITSYGRDGQPPAFAVPCGYLDAVRAAGAMPVILAPGETDAARLLDRLDGLLLSGGGDIAPHAYGGRPHETIYAVSEERDAFEFALTRAALARDDFPLLCICRGTQVLNVVCGGTLHEHVPERFGERVPHRRPPRLSAHHSVRIEPASRLAAIVGTTSADVCSWHHQAIDRVGDGLRAVAWAEDGVIEAVEHVRHPHCLGVQWHPELEPGESAHRTLFAVLLGGAAGQKKPAKSPDPMPGTRG